MKKCKANYIKILAAMRDDSYNVAKILEKDGYTEIAEREKAEARAYQVAMWLLSDFDGSFKGYGEIFFPEEFKD